ncbi:MAG: AI-2E family transporter [Bacteroidales bacterium]|nr:AI-2E family transporter [Bacteroidales bacterium]
MGQSSINRLADYIIKIAGLAAMIAICCIFSNVLVYILSAVVVSLIGHPIVRIFRKIHIKKLHIPDWISALLTILIIVAMLALIIAVMIPMVVNIINEASVASDSTVSGTSWIEGINQWLIGIFPGLGPDFNLITSLLKVLSDALSFSGVTGFVGSVAGVVVDIVVGVFTVSFISFFFLKDETLFGRIICALVPNKIEQMVSKTLDEIRQLLSRYFVGLLLEMLGVALINFLGIWLIARLDVSYALGIAVIAGILNIIPYIGPLIGEVIGALLGMILKAGIPGIGLDVNVWLFGLIILAIMLAVQLIDNFVFQPLIYSTSIKAHPLEIFIVFLMAGHVGGIVGMLVAIPAYTVIRVIAVRFFYRFKVIQRLVPDLSEEDKLIESNE